MAWQLLYMTFSVGGSYSAHADSLFSGLEHIVTVDGMEVLRLFFLWSQFFNLCYSWFEALKLFLSMFCVLQFIFIMIRGLALILFMVRRFEVMYVHVLVS